MIRIAIRFLLYDKPKTIGAFMGIIISVFLIGQQTGIFLFLTGAMKKLVDSNPPLVWVTDSKTTNVNAMALIDARVQRQIASLPGVEAVYPMVIAGASAKFADGKTAGLQVVGTQGPSFVGGPFFLTTGTTEDLINEGAITTDIFDAKALAGATLGTSFEINGHKVRVAAQTKGARGFGGIYAFTTIERARYLGKISNNKISALLVKVKAGADTAAVIQNINTNIFGVRAWTKEDFASTTVRTVLGQSGIAISIGTIIIFAVIAGLFIIGLTLYSAATDRIRDYATLKAIGATNGFITRLILLQALILAVAGYGVATGLMEMFRIGIANAGTLFYYTPLMRIIFLVLTLTISLCGAIFAIRRILKLEPATVFRS
jgi:putative ABC transport system permease protein